MIVDLKCRICDNVTEADDETEVLGMPFWGWWTEYRQEQCRACYRTGGQLDQSELDRRREAALTVNVCHDTEGWRGTAQAALRQLCEEQETVTSDDLWASGLVRPVEKRAAAPIFGWAKHNKLIVDAHRTVPAAKRGANPVRVWLSLICKEETVYDETERVTVSELAIWLIDKGLAERERGYGHVCGEELAETLLSAFTIEKV